MKMKKISILAALLLACAACGPKEYPPLHQAVLDHVQASVGPDAKLKIKQIATVDSLTMGQLYEQRVKAFDTKLSQDTKFYEKYKGKKMEANTAKYKKAIDKDKLIIKGLADMAPEIERISSVIVCYDVAFSGEAATKELTTVFDGYYAAVSPAGAVLSTNNEVRGLHKGFGKYLPGYTDLLRQVGEEIE